MDRAYVFTDLIPAAGQQAARLAVLYSLGGRDLRGAEAMKYGLAQCLCKYRVRLHELGQAGCKTLGSAYVVVCMRNCRPFMGYWEPAPEDEYLTACHRYIICPWCYGRRVAVVYDRVRLAHTVDEQLVLTIGHEAFPVQDFDEDKLKDLFNQKRQFLSQLADSQRRIEKGSWLGLTIEPDIRKKVDCWLLTYRMLSLMPLHAELACLPQSWHQRIFPRPSQDDLIAAVGKACRYPDGLMHGRATLVTKLLNARLNTRLSEFRGAFYKRKAESDP